MQHADIDANINHPHQIVNELFLLNNNESISPVDSSILRNRRYRPPLDTIDECGQFINDNNLFKLNLSRNNSDNLNETNLIRFLKLNDFNDNSRQNYLLNTSATNNTSEYIRHIYPELSHLVTMDDNTNINDLKTSSSEDINRILNSIASEISVQLNNDEIKGDLSPTTRSYTELLKYLNDDENKQNEQKIIEQLKQRLDNSDDTSATSLTTPKQNKSCRKQKEIDLEQVRSSGLSLSSNESLLLRNKYQYCSDYTPYQHNSIYNELRAQSNKVPIYIPPSDRNIVPKNQKKINLDLKLIDSQTSSQLQSTTTTVVTHSEVEDENKRQFLEDLTKSIVDSETYFQKCLNELNKCAAKVVQHKDILKTTTPDETIQTHSARLEPSPRLESSPSYSTISDTVTNEKVKEIEKTMKDIDENRIQATADKRINKQYKEDLTSLIEKLKFLASYKKKVNIRPRRKGKLAKEKLEFVKKRDDIITDNNFEEVLTQMEFETSGRLSLNRQSAEIKNSVQKVVEWKRASNLCNTKMIDRKSVDVSSTTDLNKKKSVNTPQSGSTRVKHLKMDDNTGGGGGGIGSNKKRASKIEPDTISQRSIKPNNVSGGSTVPSKSVKIKNKAKDGKNDVDNNKYKRALEKVIKLTDKHKDIFGKNVIDRTTLDLLRAECARNQKFHPNSASNAGTASGGISPLTTQQAISITAGGAASKLVEDDETRLLNDITPAAVAPFSAEYSKQKSSNHNKHTTKTIKSENNVDKSKNRETLPSPTTIKEASTISISDVQYLQNLITDPNARFKSTMTIMPVTVKSYNKPKLLRKDVAEKPFEHATAKRKIDMSSVVTAAKSPVKAYISGNNQRQSTVLNEHTTPRPSVTYKQMLQSPPQQSLRSTGDFEIKKKLKFHPNDNNIDHFINFKTHQHENYFVQQPEKPLEINSTISPNRQEQQKLIGKKNTQINELIDDILTLAKKPFQNLKLKDDLAPAPVKTVDLNITDRLNQLKNDDLLKGGRKMQKVATELHKLVKTLPDDTKLRSSSATTPLAQSKSTNFKMDNMKCTGGSVQLSESEGHVSDKSINRRERKKNVSDTTGGGKIHRRIDTLALPKRYPNTIYYTKRPIKDKKIVQQKQRPPPPIQPTSDGLFANVLHALDSVIDSANKSDIPKPFNIPQTIQEDISENLIERKLNVKSMNTLSTNLTQIYYKPVNFQSTESKDNLLESTIIVATILDEIINICSKPADPYTNIKHVLYEDCSSSTLFRKLEEVMSSEASLPFTTNNSDTTVSSDILLSSIDDRNATKSIVPLPIGRRNLIFGVKFHCYVCDVLYEAIVEDIISIYMQIQYKESPILTIAKSDDALKLIGFANDISPSISALAVKPLTPIQFLHSEPKQLEEFDKLFAALTEIDLTKNVQYVNSHYLQYISYQCTVIHLPEIFYTIECTDEVIFLDEPQPVYPLIVDDDKSIETFGWSNIYNDNLILTRRSSSLSNCCSINTSPDIIESCISLNETILTTDSHTSIESFCSLIDLVIVEENESNLEISTTITKEEECNKQILLLDNENKLGRDELSSGNLMILDKQDGGNANVTIRKDVIMCKDISLFVLYSFLFTTVFTCLAIHPVCK